MSSTLPLPPKPDFEALPSRPPSDRRQRSPRKSPPPRSRPPYGDSYHPHENRPRPRNSRGSTRFDSDTRGRGDFHREDRRFDSRNHEPDRRDYRRDFDRDRTRDYDNGRDRRGYDRPRDQRDHYDRDRRYDPRNGPPPRRRSRSRRRGERSWSPRRRSPSRDRRPRSPTPPPRRNSPHRRSPSACLTADAKPNASLPSRPSAPPEPRSPFDPDNAVDVRQAQRDPSPPPTSPRPPPPQIEASISTPRASSIPLPLDKGKAKATAQPASDVNEDVKMDDVALAQQNPQPTDQPRKLSPQPPTGATFSLPPHPGLPANPKRSRTTQSSLANSNAGRSSNVRMPPIPPYEMKEIVKESLNKEIARLASLNTSQKAATEPLVRAAERSRHELEMSLLELYAAGERRKGAAAQVEEARAGTLGIGGRHEYSTGVPDS